MKYSAFDTFAFALVFVLLVVHAGALAAGLEPHVQFFTVCAPAAVAGLWMLISALYFWRRRAQTSRNPRGRARWRV